MRFVAQNHTDIGRDVVLRLGTRNAAEALGRAGEIGSLEPGKYADLAIIALPTQDAADPHTLLFDAPGKTVATVHRGRDPFA